MCKLARAYVLASFPSNILFFYSTKLIKNIKLGPKTIKSIILGGYYDSFSKKYFHKKY